MSRLVYALIVPLALGCGGGDGASAGGGDTGADTVTNDDTAVVDSTASDSTPADATPGDVPGDADPYGPYPSGPYGIAKGEILANLTWEGYVNDKADAVSTTKPFVTISLDQLRRKANFGVIHVAEFT